MRGRADFQPEDRAIQTQILAYPGQKIGLLGGSFDPPHAGHLNITRAALARFGLDQVWWLVSPGNPLKPHGPAPLQTRLRACRALIQDPRVKISDFEAHAGTRYTAQTLKALFHAWPGVRFVWLMGADNLAGFDRWDHWEWIMEHIPIGVLARPGLRGAARASKAAKRFARYRLPPSQARLLATRRAPAWCLINVPMMDISSTRLRQSGLWSREACPAPGVRVNSAP